jgi:hypothetical protein
VDVAFDAGILGAVFGSQVVDVLEIIHEVVLKLDVIVKSVALSVELCEARLPTRS